MAVREEGPNSVALFGLFRLHAMWGGGIAGAPRRHDVGATLGTLMRWLAYSCALVLAGCTSLTTELRTAQLLYKDARYEEALLWLTELQPTTASMERDEQARFYYLRGMTGFRLGQREDALHYLVLAEQLSNEDSGRLPQAWRPVMERTLQEITPTSASPHARNPLRPDTY